MATRIIKIKNLLTQSTKIWGARLYQPLEEYNVPQEEWPYIIRDDTLYDDVVSIAQISNGDAIFYDKIEAWNYIIGNYVQEVIPTTPKNEFSLKPVGLIHQHINASQQNSSMYITSQSGNYLYFTSASVLPQPNDCIKQNHGQTKDLITSLETSSGTSLYSGKIKTFYGLEYETDEVSLCRPCVIDYILPTTPDGDVVLDGGQEYAYLWGAFFTAYDFGDEDILRLRVMAPVGGEMVHVKNYDEFWVQQLNKVGTFKTPDGAPGKIPVGLALRVEYYCMDSTKTDIRVLMDYIITYKEDE